MKFPAFINASLRGSSYWTLSSQAFGAVCKLHYILNRVDLIEYLINSMFELIETEKLLYTKSYTDKRVKKN